MRHDRHPLDKNRTVPGIGPGKWDSGKLARAQEAHAAMLRACASCRQTLTEREQARRYGR